MFYPNKELKNNASHASDNPGTAPTVAHPWYLDGVNSLHLEKIPKAQKSNGSSILIT